ncbi:MAG TPA: ATP-binding protein [Ramlibacter sp.]|uniref:ATP-binding protein n=1 Tax=Ramlibacter sp. TaxID=1917967 RepID=UPI002ED2A3B4
MPSVLPPIAHLVSVILTCFATAALALNAFGPVAPVWYGNAILLVALLLHPPKTWPAFLLPFWAASTLAYSLWGNTPSPGLLALADALEATVAATLVLLTGGLRLPIFQGLQVVRLGAACLLTPAFTAAFAASVLQAQRNVSFASTWSSWYSASVLGMVVMGPFLLAWADPDNRRRAFQGLTPIRTLFLLGAAALMVYFVADDEALIFLSFPLVFALTWSFGLLGATVGVIAASAAILWVTTEGHGAIVRMMTDTTLDERLEALQIYLAAILLSSLPLNVLQARLTTLAENLRRAGEARTEFLAAMSHEIRTPMTGVLGMVDLLAAEHLTTPQQGYVDAMRSSGRHLLSIINDILDFSRIESGKLELEDVDFSLPEVIERLRSLTHPLAVERGLMLLFDNPDEGAQVLRGDPLRIRQVLLNLVSNAIKFTEQGSVTVTVMQRPREDGEGLWVRFAVHDTGVGIETEKLRQLFTPFTQADRSISRQYGGSGLGLAICKRLVEAMGGSISATSTPGVGSVFRFEIPLHRGDPAQLAEGQRRQQVAVSPQRILVAEDVQINREILRTALGKQGHALVFAHDGAEALALVQQQAFDLVLMDVQMPVMDGVEATRRIRKLPGPVASIPIVGLTANVMAREREGYLGAGMSSCLAKPIDWDELHATIAGYANRPPPPAIAPAPEPSTEPPAVLVDDGVLASLRNMAGDELPGLLRGGMQGYDASVRRMTAADATGEQLQREAHKLRGSSGTLGLAALSQLAERIEDAAGKGQLTRDLVAQLGDTLLATRQELERRGLLPE